MESAAESGFQIAQQNAHLAKLGKIIGRAPTSYNSSVAAACYYDGAEAGKPVREHGATTRPMLAHPVRQGL
jgi:hypothetical protein